MSCSEAESFKNIGNEFIKQKDFEKAAENYTKAIEICPDNYMYYSNRSAAYASLGKYNEALEDAQKTIELNPKWSKGYSRAGAALEYLGRITEARDAYLKGLENDPENQQLKSSINALSRHDETSNDSDLMKNLYNNPEFLKMAQDPNFIKKMQEMRNDPSAIFKDPKIMEFMSTLYGNMNEKNNVETKNNPETKTTEDKNAETRNFSDNYKKSHCNDNCRDKCENKSDNKTKTSEDKREHCLSDPIIKQAEDEKNKGNEAYKAQKFEEALEFYNNAKRLHPNTITYDVNISAVKFQQSKFDECIKICEEAVERGRQLGEPFKLIARALARIGNCYNKLEKYEEAVRFYNKSLSECRDPEIKKKLQETEKILKEIKEKEYISPEIAEKERELGNEAFSKGDYVSAVKHYSESIKRMPSEAKTYSNRAAAYTKLMEYHLCVQDCNKSIELDPQFVKSYLRKANALLALRDPSQAKAVYEKVLTIDFNNREAYEGLSKCSEALSKMKPEEASQSALRDPEVQEILGDPSMRMVLDQMQNDPGSAQAYLRDPVVMRKIEKLVSAGVIKIGHK